MAITWEPTITPVSVASRTANITGVATDDADPSNPITVSVKNVSVIDTPAQIIALDLLYSRYLSKISKKNTINSWLLGRESAAKAFLEAK